MSAGFTAGGAPSEFGAFSVGGFSGGGGGFEPEPEDAIEPADTQAEQQATAAGLFAAAGEGEEEPGLGERRGRVPLQPVPYSGELPAELGSIGELWFEEGLEGGCICGCCPEALCALLGLLLLRACSPSCPPCIGPCTPCFAAPTRLFPTKTLPRRPRQHQRRRNQRQQRRRGTARHCLHSQHRPGAGAPAPRVCALRWVQAAPPRLARGPGRRHGRPLAQLAAAGRRRPARPPGRRPLVLRMSGAAQHRICAAGAGRAVRRHRRRAHAAADRRRRRGRRDARRRRATGALRACARTASERCPPGAPLLVPLSCSTCSDCIGLTCLRRPLPSSTTTLHLTF